MRKRENARFRQKEDTAIYRQLFLAFVLLSHWQSRTSGLKKKTILILFKEAACFWRKKVLFLLLYFSKQKTQKFQNLFLNLKYSLVILRQCVEKKLCSCLFNWLVFSSKSSKVFSSQEEKPFKFWWGSFSGLSKGQL